MPLCDKNSLSTDTTNKRHKMEASPVGEIQICQRFSFMFNMYFSIIFHKIYTKIISGVRWTRRYFLLYARTYAHTICMVQYMTIYIMCMLSTGRMQRMFSVVSPISMKYVLPMLWCGISLRITTEDSFG